MRVSAARVLCEEAPGRVRDLERLGVRFDADRHGQLALGLEGGHSVRRIVHAGGSATGRRVVRELSALAAEEPRIQVLEHARADALLLRDGRCVGVNCEDGRAVHARAVEMCIRDRADPRIEGRVRAGEFSSDLMAVRVAEAWRALTPKRAF